jgi:hypothetical protein
MRGSPSATSITLVRPDAPATRLTSSRRTPNAAATAASAASVALPSTVRTLTRTTSAPACSPPTAGRAEPGQTRIVIHTCLVCRPPRTLVGTSGRATVRRTYCPIGLPTDEIGEPYRDGWAGSQAASNSSRRLVIGQAPSELSEITVCVTFDFGSCTLRNETPASNPSRITVPLCLPSQKPRP